MTEQERLLRDGALAILPTDTVYGIGCAAGSPEACARLYEVKERPRSSRRRSCSDRSRELEEVLGPVPQSRRGSCCRARSR